MTLTPETKEELTLFMQWVINQTDDTSFLPADQIVANYMEFNRGPGKPIKGIYTGGKGRPTK